MSAPISIYKIHKYLDSALEDCIRRKIDINAQMHIFQSLMNDLQNKGFVQRFSFHPSPLHKDVFHFRVQLSMSPSFIEFKIGSDNGNLSKGGAICF
jgi:hypothetical protein